MITELILTGFFGVADFVIGCLPEMEWTINTSAWAYAGDILSMICYLLPMAHIQGIVAFIISLGVFRITVSVIRFVLGLLPFVG